jgi:hypothetical protein
MTRIDIIKLGRPVGRQDLKIQRDTRIADPSSKMETLPRLLKESIAALSREVAKGARTKWSNCLFAHLYSPRDVRWTPLELPTCPHHTHSENSSPENVFRPRATTSPAKLA